MNTGVVGTLLVFALLFIGDWIAGVTSGGAAWGLGPQTDFGWSGWVTWVLIGMLLASVISLLVPDHTIFEVGPREITVMLWGSTLYGVLSWIFNIIPVPAISLLALRPVVVVPVFCGLTFGPAVGFVVGAAGTVLGDAITGWGVFPIWVVGAGLMGMVPGLIHGITPQKVGARTQLLLWVVATVLAVGVVLPLISPTITDPFSGTPADFGAWAYITAVVLALTLTAALIPALWPTLLGLTMLAVILFGVLDAVQKGLSAGPVVLWMLAAAGIAAAGMLARRGPLRRRWLPGEQIREIVVWGALGVIVGMGFAGGADIAYNGYSFTTAIIGEFLPAATTDVLFVVTLTPLVIAALKAAETHPETSLDDSSAGR
ncbi:MAG: hypothetical protein Kow00124_25030 [Anaerolineae bacterium]